ncbi:hypothetical protein FPZ43_04795 [Mucilaginibacter pallidiroseus]|uniref:Uncharacterized protein n=1 Tax=Mucilaginibacter pallidiroseus TaxID=2599295 RepID=A0A563UFV6_9SPHI|nr:hypothetical protein [Mucilaginibacter pallidiroseus]TWR30262.1 hypothetical protein FPZ43_04795 [Mucilaginibacter pallidiroseus]
MQNDLTAVQLLRLFLEPHFANVSIVPHGLNAETGRPTLKISGLRNKKEGRVFIDEAILLDLLTAPNMESIFQGLLDMMLEQTEK